MHEPSTLGQNHWCAIRKRVVRYLSVNEPRVVQSCNRLRKVQTRSPIFQMVTKCESEPNGLQPWGGVYLRPNSSSYLQHRVHFEHLATGGARNKRRISPVAGRAERRKGTKEAWCMRELVRGMPPLGYDRVQREQDNVAHHAKVTGGRDREDLLSGNREGPSRGRCPFLHS